VGVEPPGGPPEAARIVDMSASNAWADLTATYRQTGRAYQQHKGVKTEQKKAGARGRQGGHWARLRAKRSKSGAVSFEVMEMGAADAPLQ
jgi:hypothetical protein